MPASLNKKDIRAFQKLIWTYYRTHRRDFPWRNTTIPYRIVVSEVMLQQTQAERVVAKYQSFLKAFPNFKALANAPLEAVLRQWQGLGYNRRGKALRDLAVKVITEYKNRLPTDPQILLKLPGIGQATAASISAFAFNTPVIFIETNIRTVFIHHFFSDRTNVTDHEILPLVEATLDVKNPREWYYALMDYGVMLKKLHANPSRRSKHHTKQSRFKGSLRELRGQIIRLLSSGQKTLTVEGIEKTTIRKKADIQAALAGLLKDKLIREIKTSKNPRYHIAT